MQWAISRILFCTILNAGFDDLSFLKLGASYYTKDYIQNDERKMVRLRILFFYISKDLGFDLPFFMDIMDICF